MTNFFLNSYPDICISLRANKIKEFFCICSFIDENGFYINVCKFLLYVFEEWIVLQVCLFVVVVLIMRKLIKLPPNSLPKMVNHTFSLHITFSLLIIVSDQQRQSAILFAPN